MTQHKNTSNPPISGGHTSAIRHTPPLYVSEVIEADGQTYFLPIGHGCVEGSFVGRISLQTAKGDFIVTREPLNQPIPPQSVSRNHEQIMQQLMDAEDEAMLC
jgi:hypothetical protein